MATCNERYYSFVCFVGCGEGAGRGLSRRIRGVKGENTGKEF